MIDGTQLEIVMCATVIDRPEVLDEFELNYEDFQDERSALVFRTVLWLRDKNKPITPFSVAEKLAKRVDADHLADCCNTAHAQPWLAKEHARIIRDTATRKRMVQAGQKLIELAQGGEDISEAIAEAEKALNQASDSVVTGAGLTLLSDTLMDHMSVIQKRFQNKGNLVGVDIGFLQLNAWLGGWRPDDLVIIAARPSMGKTAFMLQSAVIGSRNDIAAVFSVEMGKDALTDRLVSSESKVPLFNIRNGELDDHTWKAISDSFAPLSERNLYVDDSGMVTVPYIRTQLRKLQRRIPAGKKLVVFVDYLQLLHGKGRSRIEEVSEISRELKSLAKEFHCAVVALAQLSRSVEQRQDKRPMMSDIRESGQIEQDADVVMFLYRDEYYNPHTEKKNIVEVIVSKNRNGAPGTAEIVFMKEYQRFLEIDRRREDEA